MPNPKILIITVTASSNPVLMHLHCYSLPYVEVQRHYSNGSSTQTESYSQTYSTFSDEMRIVKFIKEALINVKTKNFSNNWQECTEYSMY